MRTLTASDRSALIRLAYARPDLRPALLPLLKKASNFSRVVKEVEEDYKRKAITVREKNELLAAIEDAETEEQAMGLVRNHRKGRVAKEASASPSNPRIVRLRDGKFGIEFHTNRGVFVWTQNKSFTHSFKLDREDDRDRSPLTYDSHTAAQSGMKEALYEIYRYCPGDEDFVRGHEPVKV